MKKWMSIHFDTKSTCGHAWNQICDQIQLVPGWGSKTWLKKLQNAGENWGKLNNPLRSTTSLSCFHLLAMTLWLNLKNDSPSWEFPCSQLSETALKTLAALSWESLDTPIVFSSMNLVIFFATSRSFTRAHLYKIQSGRFREFKWLPNHFFTLIFLWIKKLFWWHF